MPHLDLWSLNTKDRMKFFCVIPGSEIKHVPNPAVFILIQNCVRQQMPFEADPHRDFLYVEIICSELNTRANMSGGESQRTGISVPLDTDDLICPA